jgi:hypothetical protein
MKQGKAKVDIEADWKTEPVPHKVNPGAVNQLGNHLGNPQAIEKLYGGMGYKQVGSATLGKGNQGPGAHRTVHKSGSQGRK